jgi:hypothetical protein
MVLLCGCNKQAKINSKKIDDLTQRIAQLEQRQSKQMELLQAELTSLAPELNKVDSSYFEKNRDDALFFHTNTLFLLLTIGKQIEAQLQSAATERNTENSLAYTYHTNQLGTMYLCTAQVEEAMTDQQKGIVDGVNAQTRQVEDDLLKQIKSATATDPAEMAWRQQMEADVAQIQRSLAALAARLDMTNAPIAHP